MNLVINNELFDKQAHDFAYWLIPQFYLELESRLDPDRLNLWDKYLNQPDISRRLGFDRVVTTRSILEAGVYNLVVKDRADSSVIEIDNTSIVPNSNAKFINIINLINYGTLTISGYSIYEDIFNYLAENAGELFNQYLEEGA